MQFPYNISEQCQIVANAQNIQRHPDIDLHVKVIHIRCD